MSSKRQKVIGVTVGLLMLVLISWIVTASREPHYGDRKLSEWVVDLQPQAYWSMGGIITTQPPASIEKYVKDKAAREAIKAIGPEALPFLLRDFQLEDKAIGERILKLLRRTNLIRLDPRPASSRSHQAQLAIGALGAAAEPAIPKLGKMLINRGNLRAAQILAGIGDASLPTLIEALQSNNRHARFAACVALGSMGARAEPAVPSLIAVVGDYDYDVSGRAYDALAAVGSQSAIDGLISRLRQPQWHRSGLAIIHLGKLGSKAEAALPDLQKIAQQAPSEGNRRLAKEAIQKIKGEAHPVLHR